MTKFKLSALALSAALAAQFVSAPAGAFCLLGCEPQDADIQKIFENLVARKFDPDAKIVKFTITRFWRLAVTGAEHKAIDYFFTASVEFPKGANLDCKLEGAESAQNPKPGCSASKYFSTIESNTMVKERQYIEPGKIVEFSDNTRLELYDEGWKALDGNFY